MSELSTTALLLNRIIDGDTSAPNELVQHCYPMLLKWAHGRIPQSEKSLLDTHDIVQETIMKGLNKVKDFEAIKAGAFLAYLRKIFVNCVKESLRKSKPSLPIDGFESYKTEFIIDTDTESFLAYETALNKLNEKDQEAVILRIEFGLTYQEIADAMGKPSEDAARMFISRALLKLTKFVKQ
ncbi:RNA polymerase sigma factor [Marinicella sp. W31]|uniref:RNA polymerase sigma factor n=1 Tax=Marinicella sp. W31 TaxID=3023713 RepID=UPI00375689E3